MENKETPTIEEYQKLLQNIHSVQVDPSDNSWPDMADHFQYHIQICELEMKTQISYLKEVANFLESSREHYVELYDLAPVTYLSLSENGEIIDINLTGANLLQKERSRLIGWPFIQWIEKQDIKTFLHHLVQCKKTKDPLNQDLHLDLSNHQIIPIQMTTKFHGQGETKGVFRTVLTDLTERRKGEEARAALIQEKAARLEAEKSNQAKDEFLAILSHEMRTPLQTVLSWAQILQRYQHKLDAQAYQNGLKIIEQSTKTQIQIIQDLLDVSGAITGKLHMELEPQNLHKIIDMTVESLRPLTLEKSLQLEISLDSHVGHINGDACRLQQMVWNLLNNAIKFTPAGGRIQIKLNRQEFWARLQITDNGRGISKELLPHIFERFCQGQSVPTEFGHGLGLGLAIVRHLAHLHGGQVFVESAGPGLGATFTIELPILMIPNMEAKSP